MITGRKRELQRLEELYRNPGFEFAVIYGRRRVGKTTLINEFIQDKKTIFYTATETTDRENLENLSRSILAITLGTEQEAPVYANFEAALDAVAEAAKTERIILVIDEYPYLAASSQGFSSVLQKQIDLKYAHSRLMLILCGSSMSFMEHEVLGYKSPLYGRRTAQFKIKPFTYFETREYFSRFTHEEAALAYGITGGIPRYLSLIDEKISIPENIKRHFLEPNGYLFEEPVNLLKQEVREASQYNGIIRVIARGSSHLSDIAAKTGLESGAAAGYLRHLISLGIVIKEEPVTGESKRKTIYRIADSMFRFWYRFIPGNSELIQCGMGEHAWARISPLFPAFMGAVFEDIAKQWLWRENGTGRLPITFLKAGRWWGSDPIHKKEAEIDILCLGEDDSAIFAECKWSDNPVPAEALDTLTERAGLFGFRQKFFYLFAKRGFTEGCITEAAKINARLITFEEMNRGL